MTTTLTQAHVQWRNRPADERYTSLLDMQAAKHRLYNNSRGSVVSSRALAFEPAEEAGHHALQLRNRDTGKVLCQPIGPLASFVRWHRPAQARPSISAKAICLRRSSRTR